MQTDTEVLAYAVDLLMRRENLPIDLVAQILAAPLWEEIDQMEPKKAQLANNTASNLRQPTDERTI
jgi:hypothetical protein